MDRSPFDTDTAASPTAIINPSNNAPQYQERVLAMAVSRAHNKVLHHRKAARTPISQLFNQLGEVMSELIKRPDCPLPVLDAVNGFFETIENAEYGAECVAKAEAAKMYHVLPLYLSNLSAQAALDLDEQGAA